MQIPAPNISAESPDYGLALQEALDLPVLDLLDQIGAAGWSKRKAFGALIEVAKNHALAYEQDPDPEDAPADISTTQLDADRLVDAFVDGRDLRP